jgi:hypothetical protein
MVHANESDSPRAAEIQSLSRYTAAEHFEAFDDEHSGQLPKISPIPSYHGQLPAGHLRYLSTFSRCLPDHRPADTSSTLWDHTWFGTARSSLSLIEMGSAFLEVLDVSTVDDWQYNSKAFDDGKVAGLQLLCRMVAPGRRPDGLPFESVQICLEGTPSSCMRWS